MTNNRTLSLKRNEHARLVALANIHAREIRIIELEEEIEKQKLDMEAQQKILIEMDKSIKLQIEEMNKSIAQVKE